MLVAFYIFIGLMQNNIIFHHYFQKDLQEWDMETNIIFHKTKTQDLVNIKTKQVKIKG